MALETLQKEQDQKLYLYRRRMNRLDLARLRRLVRLYKHGRIETVKSEVN